MDCERDRGFVASDGRGTVRRGLRCRWALAFMRGLSDCPWSGLKNSLAAECARIWHAGCVSMLGGAFCGGAEAECNIRPGNRHEQRDETVARHVGFESGKPYAQIRQHLQGGRKGRGGGGRQRTRVQTLAARAFRLLAQCRARGQLTRSRMRCPQSSELVELSDAQHEATAVHTLGASLGCTTACTTFLLYVCHSAFV